MDKVIVAIVTTFLGAILGGKNQEIEVNCEVKAGLSHSSLSEGIQKIKFWEETNSRTRSYYCERTNLFLSEEESVSL